MTPDERQAIVIRARALFNAGDYWAAHEALETVWRSIISDGDRDAARVWQGLIQAAAALLHQRRGNRHGVAVLGAAALAKLAGAQRSDVEVATEQFRTELGRALAGEGEPPRLEFTGERTMNGPRMTDHGNSAFDVIIVGAGPAGLCAAMYAGRGMLKALTIERGAPGGELLNTDLIEDYIGFESIKGWELAQKMTEHAKKFGAQFVTDTVERIRKAEDGWFDVAATRGTTYRAPAVILTAGGTPVKLGVPGEQEYAGKGVSYCAVCDGAFFKGEVLAVVGGGDAAVEEADYLTRYATKVYIVHRRDHLRASKIIQERAFANPKIELVWNKRVVEIKGNERGTDHLVLEDTATGGRTTLAVGGVFIFIGFKPNSSLVEGHAKHDAGGYFITDERMMTSIPGLFAAGDVRSQLTRQITTAVGDATTAAIAVEKYLATWRERAQAGIAS